MHGAKDPFRGPQDFKRGKDAIKIAINMSNSGAYISHETVLLIKTQVMNYELFVVILITCG